ncbi:MAG: alpha-L-fucosidase [Planctomycetota bacterium]
MMVNRRDFLKRTGRAAIGTSLATITGLGANLSFGKSRADSNTPNEIAGGDESYERANTDWLAACRYGVGVCWTAESRPRQGWPVSFTEAVKNFDVGRFVDTIARTGAEYLIFTATHKYQFLPAPNPVIDRIQTGRTCRRDLIKEMALGLRRHGIHLILYYNHSCNQAQDFIWEQAVGYHDRDKNRFFDNIFNIIAWMGRHYGDLINAWWFDSLYSLSRAGPRDTVTTDMAGFKVPWRRYTRAAKVGYPARLVTYNAGILRTYMYTTYQDYWAGEMRDLENPPDGRYLHNGLQWHGWICLDDPRWVHTKRDTEIPNVRFSDEDLVEYVRTCIRHQAPVAFNLSIYQNGRMSPKSLRQMRMLKDAVK